jgi:hypothetical protein
VSGLTIGAELIALSVLGACLPTTMQRHGDAEELAVVRVYAGADPGNWAFGG